MADNHPHDTPVDASSVEEESTPNAGEAPRASPALTLRTIVERIQQPVTNPVTRARLRVEAEVPPSKRGPGWDRHWRELEAYLEEMAEWPCKED
ncbi:hypothetical protein PX699_18570 [Sphingobium sp. H39-3-25]|uniref:hypothetical protein n=1 Tax=Sphingobium arseniciresistens TaxID=3030834 RepID=UPI0023B9D40C|nr:hypothetical protein [Sphingobium arseniciresistens]